MSNQDIKVKAKERVGRPANTVQEANQGEVEWHVFNTLCLNHHSLSQIAK
jgi:type VI protein secretion system component VasA